MIKDRKSRGYACGNSEDVNFAILKSIEALKNIYKVNGDNKASKAIFLDKHKKEIGVFPCITSPVQTNGRASMLAINSLTNDNPSIEYVLFLSAVKFIDENKYGTVIHFESRSNPNVTTDLLFKNITGEPTLLSQGFYDELFKGDPFSSLLIYGFFDVPECKIRNGELNILKSNFGSNVSLDVGERTLKKAYKNLRGHFLS